ncbi:MAG: M6 family metalloprotease domain-containing protein [Gemmatimonadota bacterium]|nr:MAG: M6 family metalloprotease domain-containing protein [Gemmatimonadota bacterium]
MNRQVVVPVAVVLATLVAASGLATAQDIEVAARISGRRPPQAYFDRIRQQPDAFQLRHGWIARVARAVQARQSVSDTLPLVVIPALFADSPEPHVSAPEIQRALFDGPSANGTVSEYYGEVSGGRFGIRGVTLPWVSTAITLDSAVGTSFGLGSEAGTGSYLLEALEQADPMTDFGRFDNDGPDGIPNSGDDDGYVDAVAFEFLEVAASCGGPGIWPHRWVVAGWADSAYRTDDLRPDGDPIRVNDYIIQSAVTCDGSSVQPATTIAHELGHVLGLPDLYDRTRGVLPEQRLWVVGCWSLMAAGAWGCGTTDRSAWTTPTHLGAWEKERLGWLSEVHVVENVVGAEYSLEPVIGSQRVLKIPLEYGAPADTNEYLLAEYRKQEGFDRDLPASGVLIYHVDPTVRGNQPAQSGPGWHMVRLEEADGNSSLLRTFLEGGNRGEPGDAWGAQATGVLTNFTQPSARNNIGATTGVRLTDISLANDIAHLAVSTTPMERLLERFLHHAGEPLAAAEEQYLDSIGNQNGRYDVGDLRAFLGRQGGAPVP